MERIEPTPLTIPVGAGETVSALIMRPAHARSGLVLAHGAGAGMRHTFMASLANELALREVATLRYQFPSMERGSRRPDSPAVAHAAVRAAVAAAREHFDGLRLFAGGKSFGGRMTSQAQALEPFDGVAGLVFVGFPLHPAGKPGVERAEHLQSVGLPMLFLQGTRDELADLALLKATLEPLADRATLSIHDDADHSFHVRASSGRDDAQVLAEIADAIAAWTTRVGAA